MTHGAAGVGVGKLTKEGVQGVLDGSRWAGVLPQRPGLRVAGDSLSPTFQANRQSKSITVRQEYGGLRIGKWGPLWNWDSALCVLGLCGSFMWPANESSTGLQRLCVNGESRMNDCNE